MNTPITGLPGVGTSITSIPKEVFAGNQQFAQYIPGMKLIDGTKTRDTLNTDDSGNPYTSVLRAGNLLGKETANNKYSNSIIGVTTLALGGSQTSLQVSAVTATEIVRRIGNSGNITLTGPAVANAAASTVRSLTVAFSAVNTTTGVVTITATGTGAVSAVNQINSLPFVDSTGSGTFTITVEGITTGAITYSSTAATLYANINTALNATFGTSAIVASGASLAAIILTFSGTGYAGRPVGTVQATVLTGSTGYTINGSGTVGTPSTSAVTTAGVTAVAAQGGEFIAGSWVGDTDGSQVPITIFGDKYGRGRSPGSANVSLDNLRTVP